MPEQIWAEGSGSTWESPEGDPRVVAGAEVLVGARRRGLEYDTADGERIRLSGVRRFVGRDVGAGYEGERWVEIVGDTTWRWSARDLVCLRTADGALTEERRALESLDLHGHRFGFSDAVRRWLDRSKIWPLAGSVDRRRLAMALGREEAEASNGCESCEGCPSPISGKQLCTPPPVAHPDASPSAQPASIDAAAAALCVQVFDHALTDAEIAQVHKNTLAGKYSCKMCLAPMDTLGDCPVCAARQRSCPDCHRPIDTARGDRMDLWGRCADCRPKEAPPVIAVRRQDRSGEAANTSLRDWISGRPSCAVGWSGKARGRR